MWVARFVRFWHCIVRSFTVRPHQACTLWIDGRAVWIACSCGKRFWSEDDLSIDDVLKKYLSEGGNLKKYARDGKGRASWEVEKPAPLRVGKAKIGRMKG